MLTPIQPRMQERGAFSDSVVCWSGQRRRTTGRSSFSFAHGGLSLTLLFVKDEGRGDRGMAYDGCVVAATVQVP